MQWYVVWIILIIYVIATIHWTAEGGREGKQFLFSWYSSTQNCSPPTHPGGSEDSSVAFHHFSWAIWAYDVIYFSPHTCRFLPSGIFEFVSCVVVALRSAAVCVGPEYWYHIRVLQRQDDLTLQMIHQSSTPFHKQSSCLLAWLVYFYVGWLVRFGFRF